MRRAALLLLCAVLPAATGGCGAEQPTSDAEQIEQVLDDYSSGTASRNASLLCSDVIVREPGSSLEHCIDELSLAMDDPDSDVSQPDHLTADGPPEIEGDRARQRVDEDGRHYDVILLRGPSGWRLLLGD